MRFPSFLLGNLYFVLLGSSGKTRYIKGMRPFVLDPLFRSVTSLPGIGARMGKTYERLTGSAKIRDLLFHGPVDLIDRRRVYPVAELRPGVTATLKLIVDLHTPPARRGQPYRVRCHDETGQITLVFFRASGEWIQKQLSPGAEVGVSGRIEFYQAQAQMAHPDVIVPAGEIKTIATLEPVYPLTQGLTNKALRKAMDYALKLLPDLPEWQDAAFRDRQGWPGWREAVRNLHTPQDGADLLPMGGGRARLAYDELLAGQLALGLVRLRQKKKNGRAMPAGRGDGDLRARLIAALPYRLTGAQERALAEIDRDMAEQLKMLRLLQGDVGSGKTIVAALAMLTAVENGHQAAMMAPTEILARQHAEGLKPLLEPLGLRVVVLSGRHKGKEREVLLRQIESGAAQIVIGTHALFQEGITFADLGLAVIDEQHRFGVHQRLSLSSKGKWADVLVMTATPIPRTLTLTAYGDMDVSKLDEKPPGRKPVDTRLIAQDHLAELVAALGRRIQDGARIYWVCPLVEESEKLDLAAAQERYLALRDHFGAERVGLVHGRMKAPEKDEVMAKFQAGEIDVLVATTVIEVGVDVPEASVMVIEHAERFGLAQLHQLRGRVGRGAAQSYCFLLYHSPLGKTARERLDIMRKSEDGFLIAEKDLELRGGGEILGTKQSGLPQFRLADPEIHGDLLAAARDDARLILDRDPDLKSPRGEALRILLYLFEQDQAIRYLGSG